MEEEEQTKELCAEDLMDKSLRKCCYGREKRLAVERKGIFLVRCLLFCESLSEEAGSPAALY